MANEQFLDKAQKEFPDVLTFEEWKDDFLQFVLRFATVIFIILILTAFSSNTLATNILYLTMTCVVAISAFARVPYQVKTVVLLTTLLVAGTNLLATWGVEGEASMLFLATITLAALLYEKRYEYVILGITSLIILTFALLSIYGWHTLSGWIGLGEVFYQAMVGTWTDWIVYLIDMSAMSIITTYAIRLLKGKFNLIYKEAVVTLKELASAREQLEARVARRTSELESAVKVNEKRAQILQTISEIGRYISTEKDLDKLLPLITRIVSDRFGFYHVGVFLLDETKKFALLRASNSEGGQAMLRRKHRLEVGQTGIVGNVTATGEPRIALDTGSDMIFFSNPELPETRSEMALPLATRGSIIGALDVQSNLPNAFTDADVSVLSLLADQIAIAIDNARLLEEAQSSLAESQTLFNEYIAESWQRKTRTGILGYHQTLTGGKIITDTTIDELPSAESVDEKTVEIPIRIRDQVIGVLNVRPLSEGKNLNDGELRIVQAVADRLGLALDNARLFEETSSRASRERLVTEITSRIRSTNSPQDMIQTAVEELQRALGATRVEIVPQKPTPPPEI